MKGNWDVPLFEVLFTAERVDGSKLKGALNRRWRYRPRTKEAWMTEIACRYVRRYKPLAAFADELRTKMRSKYGESRPFYACFPHSANSIGYLVVDESLGRVRATGHRGYGMDTPVSILEAAKHRRKKLEVLLSKKHNLTPKQLEAWILTTETTKLLSELKHERKRKYHTGNILDVLNHTNQ
jgi:hypothetical protein